jgi:competence protein CoiA
MKFALVDELRQEAQPNLSGNCPACAHPVIAKCGSVRMWHWAHQRSRLCDPWWENETEWHRAWKGQFPVNWQEVVHRADSSEKHIADVKTDQGWVLEFQHSHIEPAERRSRELFYPKMLWVVNGARRIRDRQQFLNAWEAGVPVNANASVRRLFFHECAIMREWATGATPVFFDFGEPEVLWWLLPTSSNSSTPVMRFPRADLIKMHLGASSEVIGQFDGLMQMANKLVTAYELQLRVKLPQRSHDILAPKARLRTRL